MSKFDERAKDTADFCLACTSCVANCPVTAAERKYRGPKLVGPAHNRMHFAEDDIEKSLDFCSNCKNCDISCPSGVSVSTLNMLERGKYYRTHSHPQRDYLLAHNVQFAEMARAVPLGVTMANLGMSIGSALGMMGLIGIAPQRKLPLYAAKSFTEMFHEYKQKEYPDKVVFYPGCTINHNEPEIGMMLVKIMQRNHIQVLLDEDFVCCGSPLVAIGYLEEAEKNAKKNTVRLRYWREAGYPVITCCTSCSLMLKHEYTELFADSDMEEGGDNVYDVFEYLQKLQKEDKLNMSFVKETIDKKKYIYHAPCHLRAQGIGLPALDILQQIKGLSIENADAGCCGISGNYGFKKEKYDLSMKIGEGLFKRIEESGAEAAVTDCGTCRMQISHGTGKEVCHPLQLLWEAYEK